MGFNWLDFIIIGVLVFGLIDGIRKGLIVSIFNVASIFISLYLSKLFMGALSDILIKNTSIYQSFKDIIAKE